MVTAHPDPSQGSDRMDWTLEVVVLPVSDIDRSIKFYRDQLGFELDHDTANEHMHVAQLTPRGSGCSIVVGDLPAQREMKPGFMKGLQLCVADAARARSELLSRESRPASRRRSASRTVVPSSASPPRWQHLGGAGAEGPRREAAHFRRGTRPIRHFQ